MWFTLGMPKISFPPGKPRGETEITQPDQGPSDEENEFSRAEKTPPRTLVTEREERIVRTSTREFIKGAVPHLPALAKGGVLAIKYGAIVVGALAVVLQAWAGQITAKKVDVVQVEAQATADRAFKGAIEPTNETRVALNQALERIAKLEATTAAQSALLVARDKEFTIEGRPGPRTRRRVDAGLVKVVKDNAAKDSKDLAARTAKPAPKLEPVSLEIPPAPPENGQGVAKPPTPTTPPAQKAEPPPTAPVKPTDSTP